MPEPASAPTRTGRYPGALMMLALLPYIYLVSRELLDGTTAPRLLRGGPMRSAVSPAPLAPGNNGTATATTAVTSTSALEAAACNLSVVYNKPHKTGSTFMLLMFSRWAKETNRTMYNCGGWHEYNELMFRDCVPRRPDPCGVQVFHLTLTPERRELFSRIYPNHVLLTTTRKPEERILSSFLQINEISAKKGHVLNETALREWLVNEFNPWELYNYHTGAALTRDVRITTDTRMHMHSVAGGYDVVLDLSFPSACAAILTAHGLFTMRPFRVNVRNGGSLSLESATHEALHAAAVVERLLHEAFVRRMAGLYERATGVKCLKPDYVWNMQTCLGRTVDAPPKPAARLAAN